MGSQGIRYFVVMGGKPTGPFSFAEIKAMNLQPLDFIKPEGAKDYKEVREFSDLSTALDIKHETTLPQYFATLDVRLLALGIDYFIALCVYAMIALLYIAGTKATDDRVALLLMGLAIIPIVKFIFSIGFEGSKRQATVGKILVGIKVTTTTGKPLGYAVAFGRNVAKLAGVLTLGLGFLSGFFDRRQQCLHDKIAHTWVVKDRLI